eukprot:4205005-Pleurochrysis_carterae.AAC.1
MVIAIDITTHAAVKLFDCARSGGNMEGCASAGFVSEVISCCVTDRRSGAAMAFVRRPAVATSLIMVEEGLAGVKAG